MPTRCVASGAASGTGNEAFGLLTCPAACVGLVKVLCRLHHRLKNPAQRVKPGLPPIPAEGEDSEKETKDTQAK